MTRLVLALAALLSALAPVAARADAARVRPDVIVVRLAPDESARLDAAPAVRGPAAATRVRPTTGPLAAFASRLALDFERAFPAAAIAPPGAAPPAGPGDAAARLARTWRVHVPPGLTPERAAALLRGLPGVETAEPIALVPVVSAPNDSLWPQQYPLFQASRRDAHAPEAWDLTIGDSTTVIAILDTGVFTTHPDLAANVWSNAAEANGVPGVDDDADGFVDDAHGWDFVSDVDSLVVPGEDGRDEDPDPNDFAGHGTGVAGVAAAVANNRIGLAGAAPGARIMPLRVGFSALEAASGEVDQAAAARAIVYAVRHGATVVNCSFATVPATDLFDACDYALAQGVVVVAAAGNNGSSHAMQDRPEVIAVAALDRFDIVTRFSNTGDYIDVVAAGLGLATTIFDRIDGADSVSFRQPTYSLGASGTSFAAPLVCGEVALVQAYRRARGQPPLDPVSMRLRVVETADDISALNPAGGYGSGRVNFQRALADPPGSYSIPVGSAAVGAISVVRAPGGVFAVAATRGGRLVRFDHATRAVRWTALLPGGAAGSPAVAVAGALGPCAFVGTDLGFVCGVLGDGTSLPGWPVRAGTVPAEPSAPALADVDGDGETDVVWGDGGGIVHVWALSGVPLAGFPVAPGLVGAARVAVADLDGDGSSEIVVTGALGGVAIVARGGHVLPGWPQSGPALIGQAPPVLTTLGADPRAAVVVLQRSVYGTDLHVYDLDGSTRALVGLDKVPVGSPAVADLDGDGTTEFAIARVTGDVAIVGGAGDVRWSTPTALVTPASSVSPEVVVAPSAAGPPLVSWCSAGVLETIDATTHAESGPRRFGDGTPTFADLDGDGLLELAAPSGLAAGVTVYLTAAPAPAAYWPTARGNAARTGSTLGALPDRIGPTTVTDLAAVASGGTVDLTWTAPFDGGGAAVARYDLRASLVVPKAATAGSGTALPAPAPSPAGVLEQTRVSLPVDGQARFLTVASLDASGNRSLNSNVVAVPFVPTRPVTGVHSTGELATSATFAWTATGIDGRLGRAAAYEVSAWPAAADTAGPAPPAAVRRLTATQPAGATESATLLGLQPTTTYACCVRAFDSLGVASPYSVPIVVLTQPIRLPLPVTDLRVLRVNSTSIDLEWTSTGNAGRDGQAATYRLAVSPLPINASNFDAAPVQTTYPSTAAAGTRLVVSVPDLHTGALYYAALRAADGLGFTSPLSNTVSAVPAPPPRPAPVTDLSIGANEGTLVILCWTSTGTGGRDGRPATYEIRVASVPIDSASFDAAPIAAALPATAGIGAPLCFAVNGLEYLQRYWFAVRCRDSVGTVSRLSNVLSAVVGQSIELAPVVDARLTSVGATVAEIEWTATAPRGATGVEKYQVRAAYEPIDEENFDRAPYTFDAFATVGVGLTERLQLDDLEPERRYWIALRAVARHGYTSRLSNVVAITTHPIVAQVAPHDVRVEAHTADGVRLAWTSAGDAGGGGEPSVYAAIATAVPPTTAVLDTAAHRTYVTAPPAGAVVHADVTGLSTGRRWWFTVFALDSLGFASPPSNVVALAPGPLADRAGVALAVAGTPAAPPVRLFWQAPAGAFVDAPRLRVLDVTGRTCRTLTLAAGGAGIATWDGHGDDGRAAAPGLYFAELRCGAARTVTRFAMLR